MYSYNFALDMQEQEALKRQRDKKKINELLDKYGSLKSIQQNSDLTDSFNYMEANGDGLIDEVLQERAANYTFRHVSSFS